MNEEINEISAGSQIKLIRKYLKLKIMEDNISFRGHGQHWFNIYELIKGTVTNGESHSALLIGNGGGGKTTLMNSVLHELSKEVDLSSDAVIVKLNGLIHYDDKVALKAITAQMQLENAVGDRVFGTFAENLSFLVDCLKSGIERHCRSMVFLLDHCDMFCGSGVSQTLLYSLLDVAHAQIAPMCVIGITSRLDIKELLEKRVKSRFSHRHIFMFPYEVSDDTGNYHVKSMVNALKEILVNTLCMPLSIAGTRVGGTRTTKKKKSTVFSQDFMNILPNNYTIPDVVLRRCCVNMKQFKNLDGVILEEWNAHVESLVTDHIVGDSLEKLSYYNADERIFKNIMFQIVCKLSPTKPFINATDIVTIIDNTVCYENRVKLIQSLSILELSLVIAIKHSMDIFDGQPVNFEMVLHRYTKFANAHSSTQTVPRPVILKAFEHLQVLEVIMPVRTADSSAGGAGGDTTVNKVQKEYKLYTLAIPTHDISEAVKGFKALPTEINHWFNNSIV